MVHIPMYLVSDFDNFSFTYIQLNIDNLILFRYTAIHTQFEQMASNVVHSQYNSFKDRTFMDF